MKRSWTCPICKLVFSRKWNLQRHLNLMHANLERAQGFDTSSQRAVSNEAIGVNPPLNSPSFGWNRSFKQMSEIADMQDKISSSGRALEYQNLLQSQVSSLQEQVASCEKRFSEMLSYHWLFPRAAIQGISGYVCRKCLTFSLKMIMDPGYDMTMQVKHRCADSVEKRSYIVLQIPSNEANIDDWAAQCLLDHINYHIPIEKFLIAKDITESLEAYTSKWSVEIAHERFGIPDKSYYYCVEKNCNVSWINEAVNNLGKAIAMNEHEALDFFKKVKSTYAIFEVPLGKTVRQFFMTFTNYYGSEQYYTDLQTIGRISLT